VTIFVQTALDHLLPPDPGGLRLMAAARATAAGLASFALVVLLGTIADVPVVDRVLGFGIALFIAATVRDSGTRQKLVTIVAGGLSAAAATTMGALLTDTPIAEAVLLPAVMFVIALFGVRGPRYVSIGLAGLIAYLIAMVSKQPAETLPVRLLVIALSASCAALVRCVILPERPEAELKRLERAIHGALAKVLHVIASAVSAGVWTQTTRGALRRQVDRLEEIVLLAQARLAALAQRGSGHGWGWLQLLEIELATERVERIAVEDLGTAGDRPALTAQIAALASGDPRATLPPAANGRLGAALDALGRILREAPAAAVDHPVSGPPALAAAGWRPALQTAAASGLAIACSELLLPERWYWAAFAAFVMFQGTRSRGESLAKGLAFVVGTSAGLVAGVLIASVLVGHDLVSLAAVVAAVFLAFQAFGAAYGVMVFWITVILGLLFGMLGYFTFDVLLLRLEESAIGVASGALVASLVLVRREDRVTEEAETSLLAALRDALKSTTAALLGGTVTPGLAGRIGASQQRFVELRTVARSQQTAFTLMHNDALRRRVTVLGACEQWARELATIALNGTRIDAPELTAIAGKAASHAQAALERLIGGQATTAASAGSGEQVVPPGPDDPARRAVRLLLRIDAALTRVAAEGGATNAGAPIALGRPPQPATR
jgi:uncharacterized membrane protein YccC